jgi:hypothetical protein
MANDTTTHGETLDAFQAAAEIGTKLVEREIDYAVGGALALGFWTARPRATIDADINLFISPQDTDRCLDLLRDIGCEFEWARATTTLRSHGFCRVDYRGRQIDFFLPITDFHEEARRRRKSIAFQHAKIDVLDAESLCVFKLMFFRLQDLADVEAILRSEGNKLDRGWVERQIEQLFGSRDPRLTRWRELATATD